MAKENKVRFGLSEIHVGTYDISPEGVVKLGNPVALPGAISLTLDPEGEEASVYADDVKYWFNFEDNGFKGDLEVVRFTDEFSIKFLGKAKLEDGGIASIKGAQKPAVYIAFQSKGDKENRRAILYNASIAQPNKEYKTKEDKTEVATEKAEITVAGDNGTGLTMVVYGENAAGYKNLFTTPPVPKKPTPAGP